MLRKSATAIVLLSCLFVLGSKSIAGILWDRDLAFDSNTNSFLVASCANKDANGVIVIAKVGPRGSFLHNGGGCVLWEVDTNGNVLQKSSIRNTDDSTVRTNAVGIASASVMAENKLGTIATLGVLGEQRKEPLISLIARASLKEWKVTANIPIDKFIAGKLIAVTDNNFIMVGGNGNDAVFLRISDRGRIISKQLFDLDQSELFTSVARIGSNSSNLVVVGLATRMNGKMAFDANASDFVLLCDLSGRIINEDYFESSKSVLLQPKVSCMADGTIVVLYNKVASNGRTLLFARCYTQELKFLWEREIFATNESTFAAEICSRNPPGFVIGILQNNRIGFHFYKTDGSEIDHTSYTGFIGVSKLYLGRVNDKIVSVFEQGSPGNIKEFTVKIKVLALN
jgi:hypothetical protein